jgi:hypothetical protein
MKQIRLDTTEIRDWDSFHQVFKRVMGFPDFYGANLDAWIDCMSYLDDPVAGMSRVSVEKDEAFLLKLLETESFRKRCPEQFEALVECTATVNRRYAESDSRTVVALAFL